MKKILRSESISVGLPPVRIYREELEDVFNTLTANGGKVEIETSEYKFDSIDELKDFQRKPFHRIKFTTHSPHISVDFDSDGIRIYSSSSNGAARGTFESLKEILQENRRLLGWIFYPQRILPIALLAFCTMYSEIFGRHSLKVSTVGVFLLLAYLLATFFWKDRNLIFLDLRREQLNFWQRNKDQISVNLLVALITGLATWWFTKCP